MAGSSHPPPSQKIISDCPPLWDRVRWKARLESRWLAVGVFYRRGCPDLGCKTRSGRAGTANAGTGECSPGGEPLIAAAGDRVRVWKVPQAFAGEPKHLLLQAEI